MFRYLVAWLPLFRLERCGWSASQPVALVTEQKSALRVQVATPPARQAGVRVGMSLAEARALAPTLQAERLDPDGERADLTDLAAQLLRVSPTVAALPPSALVAEISRSTRAAGGERAILERVRLRLEHLGHTSRVVVADDPRTALAVAAWGDGHRRVPPGGAAEALGPLPIGALDLPLAEHDLLLHLGVPTVAAFAALEPASVVGRLGPVGVAAHAVARGQVQPPVMSLWRDDGPLTLRQDLPDPVTQLDALLFVINALLRDAAARLTASGRAVVRLTLRFSLDGGGDQHLWVRVGSPTRSTRRLLDLLQLRLERFSLAAPVERVQIEVTETTPFDGRQGDLLQRGRASEALADVAARLQDALGSHAVVVPQLASRHRPEAEWRPQPVQPAALDRRPAGRQLCLPGTADAPASSALDLSALDDPVHEWEGFAPPQPPVRPSILLAQPQAVVMRASGGVPQRVQIDARWFEITEALGPERLAGEWWSDPMVREYWRLSLEDGRHAWVCREDGLWLLHGWWD
jgi:protein ImuB